MVRMKACRMPIPAIGRLRWLVTPLAMALLLVGCRPEAASGDRQPVVATSEAVPVPGAADTPASGAVSDIAQAASGSTQMRTATPVKAPDPAMLGLADEVARLGDAQALALAALLRDGALLGAGAQGSGAPAVQPKRMDPKVREWIDEAQRRAPDEVTVLVLAVYVERDDLARREALLARWHTLEPQNLAPLLHATLPEAELFEAASSASVYDSHYDDVLRLIIDTLSRASSSALARASAASPGMTRDEQAAAMALVFWAASGLPAFQRVSTPCRAPDLSVARRRECRHVAEVLLRRSDVLIAEAIGGSIFLRGPGTDAEKKEADASRREGQWLVGFMQQAYERNPRAFARRFAQLIRGGLHTTERMVMRQLVVEAGFPPAPPAGERRGSH
jgi:hypothetical protein